MSISKENKKEIINFYYEKINEFEGDIKNGKFEGKGILYDENGNKK